MLARDLDDCLLAVPKVGAHPESAHKERPASHALRRHDRFAPEHRNGHALRICKDVGAIAAVLCLPDPGPIEVVQNNSVDLEARLVFRLGDSPLLPTIIRVALLTGMRIGEILSLRWSQVNFGTRMIQVGKAKTAAGSGRGIPMKGEPLRRSLCSC